MKSAVTLGLIYELKVYLRVTWCDYIMRMEKMQLDVKLFAIGVCQICCVLAVIVAGIVIFVCL